MENDSANELKDLIELGNSIKSNIIKEHTERNGFSDDEFADGLIYKCSGLVSLLLLKNGLEDELTFNDDEIEIIRITFDKIIFEIAKNGYDATPFVPLNVTKSYFHSSKPYSYTDSVSWVLSLTVQIWNANKLENNKLLSETMKDTVKTTMKETLDIITKGAVENGGWGFTNNCDKADLYYSYTISEALADFADYINGESIEELGIKKDHEILDFLGEELIKNIENCREKTAKWLIDTYIKNPKLKLGEVLIDPTNPNGTGFKELTDEKAYRLLYYTYFVIDMLVINKADILFEKDADLIRKSIEHGIYLSRIYFDKARSTNIKGGWWKSKSDSTLPIHFKNHPQIEDSKTMSDKGKLGEPGLVPLALRCNVLYSFYIAKGADKKNEELFTVFLDERHDGLGDFQHKLWDKGGYNLLITERAVEGLVDYFDYIQKYGEQIETESPILTKDPPSKNSFDTLIRSFVADEIKNYIESPEGKQLLSKNSGSVGSQDGFDQIELMSSLNKIFQNLEYFVKEDQEKISIKDMPKYKAFAENYTKSLKYIFYRELLNCGKENDSDSIILENLENQKEFFSFIAKQLNDDNRDKEKRTNFGKDFKDLVTKLKKV